MAKLVIPGRHLITSAFMSAYAEKILEEGIQSDAVLGEWDESLKIDHIIIPITSANQRGSRYNPVPLHARVIGLERTFAPFREEYGVRVSFVPVPHVGRTDNFAEFTLKYIETYAGVKALPEDTIVWCSTKPVYELYKALEFCILPAEWDLETESYRDLPPNDILAGMAAVQSYESAVHYKLLSDATKSLWNDMPEIPEHIFRLWNDPLLTESGSLTETRDYSTYSIGMNNNELMDIKFRDIQGAVVGGRIADEGCADGALMVRLAAAFPDSDIIGIDITGEFIARVEERQRAGEFGKSFVHIYQRNLLSPVFEPDSIDTTICNSTLHEIWSYGSQQTSVEQYLKDKFTQLAPGGRLVIRDVVGPLRKEDEVYLKLTAGDGENFLLDDEALLTTAPATLSTYSRFLRFSKDYLQTAVAAGARAQADQVSFREEELDGVSYIVTSRKCAAEFLLTKDYTDNWDSEMNEEFTFWDIEEWQAALKNIGFKIVHDDAADPVFSKTYTNPWVVENRFEPSATLFTRNSDGRLIRDAHPPTNMVLVGEKPLS